MALDADTLLDRIELKQQITRWRSIAIFVFFFALALFVADVSDVPGISPNHVARIKVTDVIMDDPKRDEMLKKLKTNNSVKAVFVHLDTPGGTALGGQELYLKLKAISEVKPVVVLMRTLCTSAGYMAAVAGDYILARESTLTGSIGVIIQTFEMTDLAKDIGINPITVKSGELKAAPNPAEKFGPKERKMTQSVVDDFYTFFFNLVQAERELPEETVTLIRDGRVVTGSQALKLGLVDALGGEKEALAWLNKEHGIDETISVRDIEPKRDVDSIFEQFNQYVHKLLFSSRNITVPLDGLMLIWQPAAR